MPQIILPLLGELNSAYRTSTDSTLVPKYIGKIRADQLSPYLSYTKSGKKHPFQISPQSTLVVDPEIQRGLDDFGRLHQESTKIAEMRDILLGIDGLIKKAFFGNLVWNIRPSDVNSIRRIKISTEGQPDTYNLEIDVSKIYLTDSAHRHLAICEAYAAYVKNPSEYPRFQPHYEFAIDIYNLDRTLENQLFHELNSKQKKISATKQRQVDVTSPIGLLKQEILSYDGSQERLFDQNIEVNTTLNDRHTLMTMSVLTQSIAEMYPADEIAEAVEDQETRQAMAEFFCEFFYSLRDVIRVEIDYRGKPTKVSPFESLYLKEIEPAANSVSEFEGRDEEYEKLLSDARERATAFNQALREQDKLNSNPFVRSLAHIGGLVRYFGNWKQVIDRLQTDLIVAYDGRFFQRNNPLLLETDPETGHPMATLTEQGSLNVQVQTHTIRTIKRFFERRLHLQKPPALILQWNDQDNVFNNGDFNVTILISRTTAVYTQIIASVDVGSEFAVTKDQFKLRTEAEFPDGSKWNEVRRVGSNILGPQELREATGFEDPFYGTSIKRHEAAFHLDFPAFTKPFSGQFRVNLKLSYPSLNGSESEISAKLTLQV